MDVSRSKRPTVTKKKHVSRSTCLNRKQRQSGTCAARRWSCSAAMRAGARQESLWEKRISDLSSVIGAWVSITPGLCTHVEHPDMESMALHSCGPC
eukprot:1156745-Pelagomonas_calceolata.AAC.1